VTTVSMSLCSLFKGTFKYTGGNINGKENISSTKLRLKQYNAENRFYFSMKVIFSPKLLSRQSNTHIHVGRG